MLRSSNESGEMIAEREASVRLSARTCRNCLCHMFSKWSPVGHVQGLPPRKVATQLTSWFRGRDSSNTALLSA
jgi:hypothetical protein